MSTDDDPLWLDEEIGFFLGGLTTTLSIPLAFVEVVFRIETFFLAVHSTIGITNTMPGSVGHALSSTIVLGILTLTGE